MFTLTMSRETAFLHLEYDGASCHQAICYGKVNKTEL